MEKIKVLLFKTFQNKSYNTYLFETMTLFLSIAFLYYTSTWFTLTVIIFNYNIDMKLLISINFFNYILLTINRFRKNNNNDFYIFFFWAINIICIGLLYFSYCLTFSQIEHIGDYVLSFKYFSIKYQYTIVYLSNFFYDYLLLYINKTTYTEEQKQLITKVLENYPIDNLIFNSTITLETLKLYISFLVGITLPVYEYTNDFDDYLIFYKYPIHNIISFITNTMIIFICITFLFYSKPSYILQKILYNKVYDFVKDTLLNAKGVTFDISNEEFFDLCSLFTTKIFENYTTFHIIQVIFKIK